MEQSDRRAVPTAGRDVRREQCLEESWTDDVQLVKKSPEEQQHKTDDV